MDAAIAAMNGRGRRAACRDSPWCAAKAARRLSKEHSFTQPLKCFQMCTWLRDISTISPCRGLHEGTFLPIKCLFLVIFTFNKTSSCVHPRFRTI